MPSHIHYYNTTIPQLIIDRLTVCFTDPNVEGVKDTCGQLLNDKYTKNIHGIQINKNGRYAVSAKIPVPFMSEGGSKHPVYFEAGPLLPKLPSYRLDFNPSKQSPAGINDLMALLDSIMHPSPKEFFGEGRITRIDAAVDLPGSDADKVIVLSSGKQKHGVYSDRYGIPETVYHGAPNYGRIAAYTKRNKATGEVALRLECRPKPGCLGKQLLEMKNPLAKVKLVSVTALDQLALGFPAQLLADSIRLRGIKRALSVLEPKVQKLVEKALKSSEGLLPGGDELWAGFGDALVQAGLGLEFGVAPNSGMPEAA